MLYNCLDLCFCKYKLQSTMEKVKEKYRDYKLRKISNQNNTIIHQ